MYYVSRGSIPPTRHTQHRASDGSLYAEELFGVEGFTGRSSLLYHVTPPTRTHLIEPGPRVDLQPADREEQPSQHSSSSSRRAAQRLKSM